jgi:hypothetical protein
MSSEILVPERHVSPVRVAMVAAGLVGAGAVAGAVAGVLGATIWLSLIAGAAAAVDYEVWTVAGLVGGALGAVILPIAGFTVLRYVPLGRALLQTIVATALGGVVGARFLGTWWLAGPIGGFALAAGRLWMVARRARAAALGASRGE